MSVQGRFKLRNGVGVNERPHIYANVRLISNLLSGRLFFHSVREEANTYAYLIIVYAAVCVSVAEALLVEPRL